MGAQRSGGTRAARSDARGLSTGSAVRGSTRTVNGMSDEKESHSDEKSTAQDGTPKPGGLGEDGTIPDAPDGVAAGHTGEQSTFEPEEDEQA